MPQPGAAAAPSGLQRRRFSASPGCACIFGGRAVSRPRDLLSLPLRLSEVDALA